MTFLWIETDHHITRLGNHPKPAVLDFAKAFDKVPYHRLLQKLKQYNLDNDVIGWVESFLSSKNQRIVVDGFTSKEALVMSASLRALGWAPYSSSSSSMT